MIPIFLILKKMTIWKTVGKITCMFLIFVGVYVIILIIIPITRKKIIENNNNDNSNNNQDAQKEVDFIAEPKKMLINEMSNPFPINNK